MNLLDTKERRVLESLYTLGQCAVSAIAKDTLLNRTALYHTLQKLIKKGLVTQVVKEKVTYFEPVSVDDFKSWANARIRSGTTEIETDIAKFKAIQSSATPSLYADVKYFEGRDGMRSLYNDSLRDNKEKIIYSITDYEKGYKTLHDFFDEEYITDRIKKGIAVRSIVPESKFNRMYNKKGKHLNRSMGFIDLFKDLGIEINIYGDRMSIVAYDAKQPVGLIIKNEIITKAFKEIYKYLWKSARQG